VATYAIGDIQGCYDFLMRLLEKIHFDETKDFLWLTGDLVNRGPDSLKTLRFLKSIEKRMICVLGNHDLGMLAIAREQIPFDPKHHTFRDILEAEDKEDLLIWLEHQPLLHHDPDSGFTLVHAGFHPKWDLPLALKLAKELEDTLKGTQKLEFYAHLYGNEPDNWDPQLSGFDRLRCIVNCFTRLRFCSAEGQLEFHTKEATEKAPTGFMPWFEVPNRKSENLKIIFGHWAALQGKYRGPRLFALDTGCVWGGSLTAMRLEDGAFFSTPCL